MHMKFEYTELPDHIIEEITVLRKQILDLLLEVLLQNDSRVFFAAYMGACTSLILASFHQNPQAVKSCEMFLNKFFADYHAGEFKDFSLEE